MTLMDLLRKAKSQETCVHPEEDKTDEHVSSDETTDNDSEDGDSEEDEVSSSDEEEEVPLRVVVAIPKKSSRPPLPTMSDDTESDEDSVYEDEEDEGLPIKRPRCSIEDFRSQLSPTKSSSINGTRINMSHPPERSPEGRVIAETLRIESIANLLHLLVRCSICLALTFRLPWAQKRVLAPSDARTQESRSRHAMCARR